MCGGDLSGGTTADILITGAAPARTVWLVVGLAQNPTAFKGGTVVPVPIDLVLALTVIGTGEAGLAGVPGGLGMFSISLQALAQDGSQPGGWAISNALRADFLP
jgi:hypothetical protein